MDRYYPASRSSAQRKPLGDATSKANSLAPPTHNKSQVSPSKQDRIVPKNESLVVHEGFAVRHIIAHTDSKRLSKVSDEDHSESKRNSAISTTSTNASGSARKRKTHIGPWQLGQTIGKGGTARVREVRHSATGQTAVAKIVSKAVAESHRAQSLADLVLCAERGDPSLRVGNSMPLGLEREIVIMKLLDHKNIVRLYDIWENRNELYLIMEYVQGGELFDYVSQQRYLEEHLCVFLFRQIVAALLYCHRLHIHHRDLKPENILLEPKTMTVKLVDFGMAALQPNGNLLTTPCGSPHYAAPELLSRKPYDGAQADVWSCGVVLFVMLAGSPPFNFPADDDMNPDQKLEALFKTIKKVEFKMPQSFSPEAKDLIYKIFVVDPKQRIKMEAIWHHPLLQKYNTNFGLNRHRDIESLIGPRPSIEMWENLTPKKIDRELFRNLRTLWHSEKETTLIERLCNGEANQEKYFYSALLKHREEQLENLQYSPTGVAYSTSDYQHSRPHAVHDRILEESPTRNRSLQRTRSGFSVGNSEHLHSKHSFYEIAPSEASYDPFRASREPVNPNSNYANVTIFREGSTGSGRTLAGGAPTPSLRVSSLRVEALRNNSWRNSKPTSRLSSSRSLQRASGQHLSVSGRRLSKSSSRMSVNSLQWVSSPPVTSMRPSDLHKRAVNFSHLRRSSTVNALTVQNDSSGLPKSPKHQTRHINPIPSSPPYTPAHNVVRSRKENVSNVPPTLRARKIRDVEKEARKASTELEMVCDEAFFRSSISSSVRTSLNEQGDQIEPLPAALHNSSLPRTKCVALDKAALANRPLPPTPIETQATLFTAETPNAFTARELAEMHKRLATKYAQGVAGNQKYFNDVLVQLEKLMPVAPRNHEISDGKRTTSAPQQGSGFVIAEDNGLHVIPEEGRYADAEVEFASSRRVKALQGKRSATEPSRKHPILEKGKSKVEQTIRLVDHSPSPTIPALSTPTPWAPLVIRKQSNTSSVSEKDKRESSQDQRSSRSSIFDITPGVCERTLKFSSASDTPAKTRSNEKTSSSKSFVTLDERTTRRDDRAATSGNPPVKETTQQSGQPEKSKKSLFKSLFKKKSIAIPEDAHMPLEAIPNKKYQEVRRNDNIMMKSSARKEMVADSWNKVTQVFGWGFKPAVYLFTLTQNRDIAMHYIDMIVSNYQGVSVVRNTKLSCCAWSGSVVGGQIKGLEKTVSFDMECFQIVQNDDRVDYSIVRITQTRGAASTLRKICKQLEEELLSHRILVTDKKLAHELESTLGLDLRKLDLRKKHSLFASSAYHNPEPSDEAW